MNVDIREIAERVSILDAARLLGLEPKGPDQRAVCPRCDSDRAIQFFTDTQKFKCYSGKVWGDSVGLVAHIRDIRQREAAVYLEGEFGKKPEVKPPVKTAGFDRAKYQAALIRDHPLLKEAGITPDLAKKYDIGVSPKGTHQGMVVVPLYEGGTFAEYVGVTGFHFIKRRS